MTTKFNEFFIRLCHEETCDEIATHAIMWTDGSVYYCKRHVDKMVHVGDVMGFGVPRSTVRPIHPIESARSLLASVLSSHVCLMLNTLFDDSFGPDPADVTSDDISFTFHSVDYDITLHLTVPDRMILDQKSGLDERILEMLRPYILHVLERIAQNIKESAGSKL